MFSSVKAFKIAAQVLSKSILPKEPETPFRYEDTSPITTTRHSTADSYNSYIELAERKRQKKISKYSRKHKELKYDYKNAERMIKAADIRYSDLNNQSWSLREDILEIQNSQKGWRYFLIVVTDIRSQLIPLFKTSMESRRLGVDWRHIIAFNYRYIVDSASKKAEAFENYKLQLIQTKKEIDKQSDAAWMNIKNLKEKKEKIRRKKKKAKKKKKKLKSGC